MTDVDRSITDEEQEKGMAAWDAVRAKGFRVILEKHAGRKRLKVAIVPPVQNGRVPADVEKIVEENSHELYKYLMWLGHDHPDNL